MKRLDDCHLYGILDLGYVQQDRIEHVAAAMIEGGIDVLQLRAKGVAEAEVARLATKVQPLTQPAQVPLIVNDHPRLVQEVGAQGAHVGQDDLPVKQARELAGAAAVIGKSTHSLQQARNAASEGADYIGFGPLFATPTKPDYQPVGLEQIHEVQQSVTLPIFCIGGINMENLDRVLAAGAQRVVIVSGILRASNITSYVREAKQQLKT